MVLEKCRHFHMHSDVSKINHREPQCYHFSKHEVLGESRHFHIQSGTNSFRFLARFLTFCSHFWLGDLNVGLLISWKCPLLCCSSLFAWINNQVFLVLWNVKACFWPHVYYCTLKTKKNISERNIDHFSSIYCFAIMMLKKKKQENLIKTLMARKLIWV